MDHGDDIFKYIPVGHRFKPRHDELIQHYLRNKVLNKPLPPNKMADVNISNYNPMQLKEMFPNYGEKDWYFFSPRNRKYPKGNRPNRGAGNGFWKASGADKPIYSNGIKIGVRKSLVFYIKISKKKSTKTNWIMQEYRLPDAEHERSSAGDMILDDWVLCKIYMTKRKPSKSSSEEDDESNEDSSDGIMLLEDGLMHAGTQQEGVEDGLMHTGTQQEGVEDGLMHAGTQQEGVEDGLKADDNQPIPDQSAVLLNGNNVLPSLQMLHYQHSSDTGGELDVAAAANMFHGYNHTMPLMSSSYMLNNNWGSGFISQANGLEEQDDGGFDPLHFLSCGDGFPNTF